MISQIANITAKNFKYKFEQYSFENDSNQTTLNFCFLEMQNLTKQIERINLEYVENSSFSNGYKNEANFDQLQVKLKLTLNEIGQLVKNGNDLTQVQQEIYKEQIAKFETEEPKSESIDKKKMLAVTLSLIVLAALGLKITEQSKTVETENPTIQQINTK